MKIDLGCGQVRLDGYTPWDWSTGHDVSVLPFEDGSLEEIRASHVLEHIGRDVVAEVLAHWVSKLMPGGILRIAVPDLDRIVEGAIAAEAKGEHYDIEGYIAGGQTDALDIHRTLWNEAKLRAAMESVGITDIVHWRNSSPADSSDLQCSVNLAGRKPWLPGTITAPPKWTDVRGVMTMPRLAWTDTMFCGIKAVKELGIDIVTSIGVFYGQGMQRVLTNACTDPALKWALTIDYDSLFDWRDIVRLREIAERHGLDAIAPLQAGRERVSPLLTASDDGKNPRHLRKSDTEREWFRVATMHFGLTLIRLDSLRKLPKPWFASEANADGEWETGKIDDDIWFWKQAAKSDWTVGIAPSVTIGHIETVATWVGPEMASMYQPMHAYLRGGKPWYVRARERWRHEPSLAGTTLDGGPMTAAPEESHEWPSAPTHSPALPT